MEELNVKEIQKELKELKKFCETANKVATEATEIAKQAASDNARENQKILENIKLLQDTIKPIAEIYTTVGRVGKWLGVLIGVVATLLGIVLGIKTLLKQ